MAIKVLTQDNFVYIWNAIKRAFATKDDLAKKVDKVDGKTLSSNDYTADDKAKLTGIEAKAQVNAIEAVKVNGNALAIKDKAVDIDLSGKVDKVAGKGLSTNDLTDELLKKLQNAGDSTFTGNYSDLIGAPDIDTEAMTAFGKSEYAKDLSSIKADYVTKEALQKAISDSGHAEFQVVEKLPDTGAANVIYYVKNGNAYDEYVYSNKAWDRIGNRKVDLSGVWAKADLEAATNADIDAIINGTATAGK